MLTIIPLKKIAEKLRKHQVLMALKSKKSR